MAIIKQPIPPQESPIRSAWLKFCDSTKSLLVPRKDNRPLDQYLALRDKVFEIVQGEEFLNELMLAYDGGTGNDFPVQQVVKEALLLELQAFPRAAEVVRSTQKRSERKRWWNRLLKQAGTVSGSVKDILADNSPILKGGLTLFGEVTELFKKE